MPRMSARTVTGLLSLPLAVTRARRAEYKIRPIVNAWGEERVSRAQLFFNGDAVFGLRDRLVLHDGTAPTIQLLYEVRDAGSIDHWEVWI